MTYRGLLTATSVLSVVFLASLMHGGDDPVIPAQPVRAAMAPLKKAPQSGVAQVRQSALQTSKPQELSTSFALAGIASQPDDEAVLPVTQAKASSSTGGDAIKVVAAETGTGTGTAMVMGPSALPADVLPAAFAPAAAPASDVASTTPVLAPEQNTLSPIHRVPAMATVPAVPEPESHALLLAGLGLLGAAKGIRRVLKTLRK
jgi:hypothetical protein